MAGADKAVFGTERFELEISHNSGILSNGKNRNDRPITIHSKNPPNRFDVSKMFDSVETLHWNLWTQYLVECGIHLLVL